MSRRLIDFLVRLRWPLLAIWLVALSVAGMAALPLADKLSGGGWFVQGSDSQQATEVLKSGFADRGASNITLVVRDERHTAGSPEFADRVERVTKAVVRDERLEASGSYGYATVSDETRGRFVGDDKHTALTQIAMELDDGDARRELPKVQDDLKDRYEPQGLKVSMVSAGAMFGEINELSLEGLVRAELIALPLLMVILLLLYRGVMAAVVSFVVAVTGIVLTLGCMSLLADHTEISVFAQNAATMIGLGVGVDYSLFIIARYTEELAGGRDRVEALHQTMRTSGRAVAFSGLIIVLAMSGLFLVELNVIQSIALGIVAVVAFAVLASVFVLPLVLYLLGDRILWGRLPMQRKPVEERGRRWQRLSLRIMRRPWMFLGVACGILLAVSAPALGLQTFTPDARIVPTDAPVRQGYDTIREEFGQGDAAPINVVVTADKRLTDPDYGKRLAAMERELAQLPHVSRVDSPLPVLTEANRDHPFSALEPAVFDRLPKDGQASVDHFVSQDRRQLVLEVVPDNFAASEQSRQLLDDVRKVTDPVGTNGLTTAVGGETAEGVDANKAISDGLPIVLVVMLVVVYVLLLFTFRSLLLPLKAIAINLLSVGATYGILVLLFQTELGSNLMGTPDFGYLQNFVPILLLAILFSLSTDYEVFLLHRIREEYDAGADNTTSVATGMARTAPLISGAAVLMIAVFGAFGLTGIMPIQQLGIGLAFAVALDATVIRLIVVPAAMRLMGRWNWWLPGSGSERPVVAAEDTEPAKAASATPAAR